MLRYRDKVQRRDPVGRSSGSRVIASCGSCTASLSAAASCKGCARARLLRNVGSRSVLMARPSTTGQRLPGQIRATRADRYRWLPSRGATIRRYAFGRWLVREATTPVEGARASAEPRAAACVFHAFGCIGAGDHASRWRPPGSCSATRLSGAAQGHRQPEPFALPHVLGSIASLAISSDPVRNPANSSACD